MRDYEVEESEMIIQKKVTLSEEQMKEKHPMEYLAVGERRQMDIYRKVGDNQVLIFNMPDEVKEGQVREIVMGAKKDAVIGNIQMKYALKDNKLAYAVVTFASSKDAK